MINSPNDNPFRQDGGLPHLALSDIDERLDRPGKSVEQLSDPMARLVVLWTLVGQYDHAARMQGGGQDGVPTVADAQRYQLLSTWAHESRRVMPRQRLEEAERPSQQRIRRDIQENRPLEAFMGVVNVRDWAPEMMHPDVRFDLLYAIWAGSSSLNEQDSFRDIVVRNMVDETMPGGEGYCDNAERARRYHRLTCVDEKFEGIVREFLSDCLLGLENKQPVYFDDTPLSMTELCSLVGERGYAEIAKYMLDLNVLGLQEELLLLPALDA